MKNQKLEMNGFRSKRKKIEYIYFYFDKEQSISITVLTIDEVTKVQNLKYLGCIFPVMDP